MHGLQQHTKLTLPPSSPALLLVQDTQTTKFHIFHDRIYKFQRTVLTSVGHAVKQEKSSEDDQLPSSNPTYTFILQNNFEYTNEFTVPSSSITCSSTVETQKMQNSVLFIITT